MELRNCLAGTNNNKTLSKVNTRENEKLIRAKVMCFYRVGVWFTDYDDLIKHRFFLISVKTFNVLRFCIISPSRHFIKIVNNNINAGGKVNGN